MNVLTDFHHAGLLNSFILLFEKRLKGKVYRPIGRRWYDEGYWKVYEHPATVAQFLDIGGATPDGTDPVNQVIDIENHAVYKCFDIDSHFTNRAITFEGFMERDFNIVIATIPRHIEPFKRLCELHPNKPKLIYQIGNAWTVDAGLAKNIMASAIINGVPPDINFISYHQEFDLDIFTESEPVNNKNIKSFVNVFNLDPLFRQDWELFAGVEKLMPDWDFKCYGGQCRDGAMHGSLQVANAIAQSRWVWHTKNCGDGYGHIIHNVPAMRRPLIVKKDYYNGKLAEKLLIDGVTCITIDGLNADAVINKIMYYNDDNRYLDLCHNAYINFKQVVDFDAEQKAIETFLSNLI